MGETVCLLGDGLFFDGHWELAEFFSEKRECVRISLLLHIHEALHMVR